MGAIKALVAKRAYILILFASVDPFLIMDKEQSRISQFYAIL